MESYLTQISNYLLGQSWQIIILVVVVAAVSWLLRNRSAHIRYLLWLIVLAKCLIPPLFAMPIAVLPQKTPTLPISFIATPSVEMFTHEPAVRQSEHPVTNVQPEKQRRTIKLSTNQIVALIWMAGIVIFSFVAIIKALRTNHWLKEQRRALPAKLKTDIEESLVALNPKSLPKLWLLNGIGQPFVWGLLRGDIYLPTDFTKLKDSKQRKDILGHEISHVLRFDAAVNMLQVIAQAIFWFHPFVWWANRKIRAEREKCCDEMAIARMGAIPKDYSKAIVNILVSEHKSTRPVPSLAVAGPVKNIEERIKTMLRPGKKFYKRPSVVAATIVLLLALITVPTALVLTARAEAKATAESNMLLYNAISKGDAEQVRSLISQGADVNTQEELGFTPLHLAALLGNQKIINILIDEGANPNIKIADEITPIYCAIVSPVADRMKVTELLIDKGAEFSKIHIASFLGDLETVKDLINHGADIDSKDIMDTTPLHFAAAGGQKDIIKFLIDKGSDINAGAAEEFTPLHTAVCFSGDPEVINLLIAKGADVKVKGLLAASLETAAVKAMISRLPEIDFTEFNSQQFGQIMTDEFTSKHDSESTKLLLSKGAKIDEYTLFMAAEMGIKHIIESAIAEGFDLNIKDHDGATALWYAKEKGHTEIVELLQKHGAKEIAPAPGALLCRAASQGDIEKVKSLIEKGINVNTKDKEGYTAIYDAAARGHKDVVEFLINKGADINIRVDIDAKNSGLWTPLQTAVRHNQASVVELLISKGASVNTKDKWGFSPLHTAAKHGYTGVAEHLIDKGADLNAKNNNGETPLHIAARRNNKLAAELLITKDANINAKNKWNRTPMEIALDQGHRQIVELLHKHGARVLTSEGATALHEAAAIGDVSLVKSLISQGMDVDAKDDNGQTPLHEAAKRGHKDVAELLISKGADIEAKILDGETTPLLQAISQGNLETVALLLDKGANVQVQEGEWGPVASAMWKDQKEIIKLLSDKRTGFSDVHIAAYFGDLNKVKRFLSDGGHINARGPSGFTLLHCALCGDHKELAQYLITKGANVNLTDSSGWPPLHFIGDTGASEEMIELLLDNGADVNLRDKQGRIALHWAAAAGQKPIVEMLIARGSNVNARTDSIGTEKEEDSAWTPLHRACEKGHKDIAEILITNGANINAKTKRGKTALSLAKKNGHEQVVELLSEHRAKE
jgi:ankyrin repeat protein/beta-lactamase regulating signal transducer with metallopeptidase domain